MYKCCECLLERKREREGFMNNGLLHWIHSDENGKVTTKAYCFALDIYFFNTWFVIQ